jgi:hypothetical protein
MSKWIDISTITSFDDVVTLFASYPVLNEDYSPQWCDSCEAFKPKLAFSVAEIRKGLDAASLPQPNRNIPESEHRQKVRVRMLVTPQPSLLNEIANTHWEDPGDYPR